MAANGARIHIYGDYDPSGVRRAERDISYLDRQAAGFSKSFMSSFTGMGAAIGGALAASKAIEFLKDSIQAAMDDQAAMESLARAMSNVGQGFANTGVEKFIDDLQRATGVADDQLRPAFQKLVTVTKDAAESQRLLKLAMDVSAGTGKDLEAVSMALAKAASGQTTALQRLGVGLDQATLKSKDMNAITAELSSKFQGQAATAANTYQGQLNRLKIGFSELQESFGYGFLSALDDAGKSTDSLMQSMKDLQPMMQWLGKNLGENARGLGSFITILGKTVSAFDALGRQIGLGNTALSTFFSLVLRSPLGWFAQGVDALTAHVESGTSAWKDYWGAAAGPGGGDLPGGGTFGSTSTADGKNWGAYYLQNQSVQEQMALARVNSRKIYDEWVAGLNGGGGGGGGAKPKPTSQFAQNVQALSTALASLVADVGTATTTAGKASFDNINKQIDAFKSKFSEAKSFAQGIVDSFMGQLDLGAAIDAAKAAGTSIVEEFSKQGEKAVEFGNKMQELLKRGLSKAALQDIMKLGFDRGMDVMNELSTGAVEANIANVNKVYDSVELMANTVADQAKEIFYDAGLQLMITAIRAMIKELMPDSKSRRALMHALDDLAASMNRTFTITGSVVMPGGGGGSIGSAASAPVVSSLTMFPDLSGQAWIDAVQADPLWQMLNLPGGGMFADGGVATSPTPGIFGEAGPEALIPLDRMGDFGGSTYNITVQAGVGDPRAIGKSVVEAITLFERSSGPVFARA